VTIADGIDKKERVVATAGAFLQVGETVRPVGETVRPVGETVRPVAEAAATSDSAAGS
jgi:hypothetical protein